MSLHRILVGLKKMSVKDASEQIQMGFSYL
jgi:hypothetical protein